MSSAGRPETKEDNNEVKIFVESYPSQSSCELSLLFGVSDIKILTYLAQSENASTWTQWLSETATFWSSYYDTFSSQK